MLLLTFVNINIYKKAIFYISHTLYQCREIEVLRKLQRGEIKMGYALFTARKLSLSTRINMCNANLTSNTEKTYALSNSIFTQQSKAALELTTASQNAYSVYEKAVSDANEKNKGNDAAIDTAVNAAEAVLQKALKAAELKQTMTNVEIQKLNQKQTILDQERQRLQTQLTAYQNELTNVEKAEESAIKNATPKF